MAELDTSSGKGNGKVRSKKQSTRVDLTAMVDLAFLLITFFMLTTSLSKPMAMDIAKPDKDEKNPENKLEVKQSQTMTVLLVSNDRVMWYMGIAGESQPTIEGYQSLRKSLLENKKKVKDASGKDIMVIVKPTDASSFKNFVDMMDEINITQTNLTAPAVDDDPKNISEAEMAFMVQNGLLKK